MQVIPGGLRPPKKQRYAARWALAVGVLALAFPATALGAHTHVIQSQPTASSPGASPSGDTGVGLGDTVLALGSGYGSPDGSPLVRAVQRRLALAGYPPAGIDGLYGPRTSQAVAAFQASHGLQVDGVVGPRTWVALSAPALVLGPGAGDQSGGSNAVRSLQRRLASAGDSPGPIDGLYGVLTEEAVRRLQRAHGLSANGIAGPSTLALLVAPTQSVHRSSPPALAPPSQPVPSSSTESGQAVVKPSPAPAQRPGGAAPRTPSGSRHRPGSRTMPWMTIAGALALALALILSAPLLMTALRRRHRRDNDVAAFATTTNGHDSTVTPVTAGQIATNGANGTGGAESRPSRTEPELADPAEAAVAPVTAGQIATNGANGNGGPESRPSRSEPELADPAEAAAAAFDLGLWLEAQGSLIEARAAYGRADECGHGAAASHLGRLLEEQGTLTEAEAAYRRADERGDGDGAFSLGLLLEERGALDGAAAAYDRAIERGNDAAASNLGALLVEQGALAQAEAVYRRADQHGDATAAFNLGVLLEERGALVDAEQAYRRAEQHGDGHVANMARAALIDLGGELQEASASRAEQSGNA
jgi:peptidoglycan hydrolase-like protein with peptidoglycan-binding domain/Tfp pilus assembly protein PilF